MKKMFESPIDMEEFEKAQEWHKKVDDEAKRSVIDLETEYIASLSSESEESIVKRFVHNFREDMEQLNADYLERIRNAKEKQRGQLLDEYRGFQKYFAEHAEACLSWLRGNKKVDISFISDIKAKRNYAGKSKKEIRTLLSDREARKEIDEYGKLGEKAFVAAVNNYAPVRERASVVREMTELEKKTKRSLIARIRARMIKGKYVQAVLDLNEVGIYDRVAAEARRRI